MASNVKAAFAARENALLIPYVTAGWPRLDSTPGILRALEQGGADVIEIGVPFSDPSADGAAIQRSSERALGNGANLSAAFDAVKNYRDGGGEVPVVFMGYANPFLRHGFAKLADDCQSAGVDAILAVDWPPLDDDELKNELDRVGVDRVALIAPTASDERIKEIVSRCGGYAYYVSMQGVTGARVDAEETARAGERAKKLSDLPVAVGFGVRTPEDCAVLGKVFDAIVVGSKLVETIDETGESAARDLIEKMKTAMAK